MDQLYAILLAGGLPMEFRYQPALLEYMAEKGRSDIAVEVAATNHSDIDVTEIYVRLISRKMLQELRKKNYRIGKPSGKKKEDS